VITVKDVWRGALPEGTELLGGGAGLERRVEWATALRTRPPAFDAIKGGELAFVPVKSIRMLDERLDLAQVMQSFAEKGGVAVAIIGDASQDGIAVAERMMLPLLRLPEGAHAADVQQATVRYILDQRTLLHERQQELQLQLMELALAGAGTAAILDRLSEISGHAAAWQDLEGNVQHASAVALDPALLEALTGDVARVRRWAESTPAVAADPPVHEFPLAGTGQSRLVAPVPLRDRLGGFVSLIAPDSELDQMDRLAVARAASACAIELDRERAVLQARDEMEGEFLDSLLAGTYSSEAVVRNRAERLGFDLSGSTLVLLARPDPGRNGSSTRVVHDRLAVAASGWTRRRAPSALVAVRQGALAAVVPIADGDPPPDASRLAGDLRLECAGSLGDGAVSVGVGRSKPGIAGVRASYREAEQALTMGVRLFGGARTVSFADLGLYRLLFALQGQAELREFFDDRMRLLADYDARTGAGLVKTLDAFFRCHGSPTEIASLLHLHRNTVLYRLRRIEEIGGLQLDDPETRLALHLCLKVREVLAATPAER